MQSNISNIILVRNYDEKIRYLINTSLELYIVILLISSTQKLPCKMHINVSKCDFLNDIMTYDCKISRIISKSANKVLRHFMGFFYRETQGNCGSYKRHFGKMQVYRVLPLRILFCVMLRDRNR